MLAPTPLNVFFLACLAWLLWTILSVWQLACNQRLSNSAAACLFLVWLVIAAAVLTTWLRSPIA